MGDIPLISSEHHAYVTHSEMHYWLYFELNLKFCCDMGILIYHLNLVFLF